MDHSTTYNPQNAGGLTQEQLAAIPLFTVQQIAELARRYPNTPVQNPYLVLKDTSKSDKDQLYPLSTWENLWELRKSGLQQFVAIGFKQHFQKSTLKIAPVQDLTEDDLSKAEGLKRMVQNENISAGIGQPQTGKPVIDDSSFEDPNVMETWTKGELQQEYENQFGEKPKSGWPKPALLNALNTKTKIEL